MTNFGILVKSYAYDFEYAKRLLISINRHNVEKIPVYLVVPTSDVELFREFEDSGVFVLAESLFDAHLTTVDIAGLSAGYLNQEVIKLCFWELGLLDNYLCMDSDAEFIRDFFVSDFMADQDTPYTFLTEDSELRVEPGYFAEHWAGREVLLRRIYECVGVEDDRILTVHGHAVFSSAVLLSFRDKFLLPRGWDYLDALQVSPYEPTWYNAWLMKDHTIPIIMREPIIKTFHNGTQQLDYLLRGVTESDVARGYAAVVVNSNYSRADGLASLNDSPSSALASLVDSRDLVDAIQFRLKEKVLIQHEPLKWGRRSLGALLARVPGIRKFVDLGE